MNSNQKNCFSRFLSAKRRDKEGEIMRNSPIFLDTSSWNFLLLLMRVMIAWSRIAVFNWVGRARMIGKLWSSPMYQQRAKTPSQFESEFIQKTCSGQVILKKKTLNFSRPSVEMQEFICRQSIDKNVTWKIFREINVLWWFISEKLVWRNFYTK